MLPQAFSPQCQWDGGSERPLRQTPVAITGWFFFWRDGVLRPVLRVFGALFVAGIVAQPELHFFVAPTSEKIVKPAPARMTARQIRRIAQAALPKFGVKFAIAQVVGVPHVETAQREVVKQLQKNWHERFIRDFSGWQQRNVSFGELFRGRYPVLRFHGPE